MYIVYQLLDYRCFVYYIGITKNWDLRYKEHVMNKNATPAKTYRTRKSIEVNGYLPYKYTSCDTLEDARKLEKKLIKLYQYQLVNKTHGKIKNEKKQRRSKGRSVKCPYCGNYFKRIGAHKCKMKTT